MEKILANNIFCGEKMTNMRFGWKGFLLCVTSLLSGICQGGWSEVTLTPTYPSPSLTGQAFPNPGWHLPTNIRITPQIFPLPSYGGDHASVNYRTWTAFRYIAAVFWAAEGDGWDRWWQKSANLTKLERQPDLLAHSNHSLHLRNCATFPFEFWHQPDLWFWNGIFGTYINWETLSFCSNSPHVDWIFW